MAKFRYSYIIIFLLLLYYKPVYAQQEFFKKADIFFKTYVNNKGMVDYEEIKKNQRLLNELVFSIGRANYFQFDKNSRKAFLINSYNILVIREIIDLMPINGPLENSSFFNGIYQLVGGKEFTLDQIEKEVLGNEFQDPRLHFVLVCGAMGCPPLANFAYLPVDIEGQIEERTRFVLNLGWFIKVSSTKVEFSQIFNWYRTDFEINGLTLISYLNKYRSNKIDLKRSISFYEYDWSLNKQ